MAWWARFRQAYPKAHASTILRQECSSSEANILLHPGCGIEGARLLEQVRGAGHDGQVILAAQLRLGPAVEVQHHLVTAADDEQHRRGHGSSRGRAWSGQPPRDTTAATPEPRPAAAHSAAAAVLAPK